MDESKVFTQVLAALLYESLHNGSTGQEKHLKFDLRIHLQSFTNASKQTPSADDHCGLFLWD